MSLDILNNNDSVEKVVNAAK